MVPTTSVQSATASATVLYSSAFASSLDAPTAETASRNAFSYGTTTRKRWKPKLLMARAAAPMLSGFRAATSTTRNRPRSASSSDLSSLSEAGKNADFTTLQPERRRFDLP